MRAVCKGPRCLRQASAPDIAHDRMPCYVTEGSRHVVAGNAGNVGDVIQRDLGGEMAKDLRYRVRQLGPGSGRASLGRRAGPRDPLPGCSCSHRHVARCFAKSKIPRVIEWRQFVFTDHKSAQADISARLERAALIKEWSTP
jgi:hypothetical protein